MSVGVRVRFEVFKRDRFTCSYCGRTPPTVLLEADHIVPRAAGGSDEMSNLTTSCQDCNRGKAAGLLEEGTAPVVSRATVEELAERVEQAKAYMELLGGLESVVDNQVGMVTDTWAKRFGAVVEERTDGTYWRFRDRYGEWPDVRSVRRILHSLTLADLVAAIDITASKFSGSASNSAVRYFFGICHRAIREGRPVGSPKLAPTQDPDEAYGEGVAYGDQLATQRIGELLKHPQEHGFETLTDAVLAIWPED